MTIANSPDLSSTQNSTWLSRVGATLQASQIFSTKAQNFSELTSALQQMAWLATNNDQQSYQRVLLTSEVWTHAFRFRAGQFKHDMNFIQPYIID